MPLRYHYLRLGRFTSPDPIAGSTADPQTLNRYAYTRNDPVNSTDPLGLLRCTVAMVWNWTRTYDSEGRLIDYSETYAGSYIAFCDFAPQEPNQEGSDVGGAATKKKDLIKAALKEKNLSKCLHKFFGPGTILTNENLPRIDATKDLYGGRFGQTDASQVPDKGRATVQIDKGIFTSLPPSDPQLVGTYLHETANALAIQRFTDIYPRAARARRGPLGGPPTEAQERAFDKDIGEQFEKCIFGRE